MEKQESAIKYIRERYYHKELEDWHYKEAVEYGNVDYYKNYDRMNEFNKPYHEWFCDRAQMYLMNQAKRMKMYG